ncbi:unnamed protein product [Prunus armeniaca]
MEAQKRGSAKGKRKAESNMQQSRVGRDAFFNFMKEERHEMGKMANAKLDSKMQEEIANKWRKLNPKEKATYGSALEGSTGQVDAARTDSIVRFNPDTSSIELHGKVFGISPVEFGRVMGLKNTDEDVELDSPVEDEKCENANKDFKVRFVMFALGTVLCPTSSPSVTGNYLTFLTIPGKIETKNWANHGFKFLCEGVRSFKAKKVLDPIVSWDNQSVWKMIKWVRKQGGFESPTIRVVSKYHPTNEVSGVNLERIVQEVSMSLAPVMQAKVKRSIEGHALGPIIQAEL